MTDLGPEDDAPLTAITVPRSVPCVVCGAERVYLLELEEPTPPPPLPWWREVFERRQSPTRRLRELRCGECGAL